MKIVYLLIIFFALTGNLHSQGSKIINFGRANQSTNCSDGYIDSIGNSIALFYNNYSGFMIGSFDSNYNVNWILNFGQDVGADGKLIKLSNGDFFAFGGGHLFKFNSVGTILWHKALVGETIQITQCLEMSNGNIAIIGKYGAGPIFSVFDVNGELLFSKKISDGHTSNFHYDLIKTNDGNHLLIGGCQDNSHDRRLALTKFDSNFNILWEKCFEYNAANYIQNSIQSSTNDFYFVGKSANLANTSFNEFDLSILKFNEFGNYLKGKTYGSDFHDEGMDIAESGLSKSGVLTIIGHSKPVEICGDNLLVVSINSNLDTLFTKHYGSSIGSGSYYTELHTVNDSLYSFGSYSFWSNIGTTDGHLIKTGEQFDLECGFYKNGLEYSSNLDFTEIPSPFSYSNMVVSVSDSIFVSSSSINVSDACNGQSLGIISIDQINWMVLPNPTDNSCTISGSKIGELISILTLDGKSCKTVIANESETQIDLSELSSGVYFVKIGEAQKRLIKK